MVETSDTTPPEREPFELFYRNCSGDLENIKLKPTAQPSKLSRPHKPVKRARTSSVGQVPLAQLKPALFCASSPQRAKSGGQSHQGRLSMRQEYLSQHTHNRIPDHCVAAGLVSRKGAVLVFGDQCRPLPMLDDGHAERGGGFVLRWLGTG